MISAESSDVEVLPSSGAGGPAKKALAAADWSESPVGPPESWDPALKTAAGMCLPSSIPMNILWGDDLVQIYNDEFSVIMGDKHPAAMGRPTRESWSETWETSEPLYRRVLENGETIHRKNVLFPVRRHDYLEEAYFTVSYSPIYDEMDTIRGILVSGLETTETVMSDRRVETLNALLTTLQVTGSDPQLAVDALAENTHDLPFVLLYLLDASGQKASLAACNGLEVGGPAAPLLIALDGKGPWPLSHVSGSGKSLLLNDLRDRFGEMTTSPWPTPITSAMIHSLNHRPMRGPLGFLITGINPGRRLNDDYREFLTLVADKLQSALESRRYEKQRQRTEAALRESKMEAEKANRAKSIFLANMSHEIRTPLTSMVGFAALLTRGLKDRPLRYARRIEQSGMRLTETLNDILMLAEFEAGRSEISPTDFPLAREIREIVAPFERQARSRGLDFSLEIGAAAEELHVHFDRSALASILQNLLGNAVKFTPEGRITAIVDIDAASESPGSETGMQIRIVVEDSGIGIAESYLPQMFEPFTQESSGSERTYEGSGLGLSIARQLAVRLDGSIEVDSTKGEGSRFTVLLPASPVASSDDDTAATRAYPRALLVEDNPDTQILVRDILSGTYDTTITATAADAIEAATDASRRGEAFDVILVDINLGGGPDGTEVINQLRTESPYQSVPFVAITAFAMPGDERRFLNSGFDAYLSKPFTVDELVGMLKRLAPSSRSA